MNTAPNLQKVIDFLTAVIRARFELHFGSAMEINQPEPQFFRDHTPFAEFIDIHQPTFEEYVVVCLALLPHLQPDFLTVILGEFSPAGGDFPEIGGVRGQQHRGFLPTGETAVFLIAGTFDLEKRLEVRQLFADDHFFAKINLLFLEKTPDGEPSMSGKLVLEPEFLQLFLTGKSAIPKLSVDFPAQLLQTSLTWDDLVLPTATRKQIREIEIWIQHQHDLMEIWGMKKFLKPGFRTLFHGAPGTGKTLTATLLGQQTGRPVFRIDLSVMVSKFIGETEKNLARLFDRAEHKNWILFFDEADSIFGKRTQIRDAHDKYANQEVAYLLQRIESHAGLVILATNFKSNIDEAFSRRFQNVVHFPMPSAVERLKLWARIFPPQVSLAAEVDLAEIARKYELSGSNMLNIVQFVLLESLDAGTTVVTRDLLLEGIHRENRKENRGV